MVWPANDGSWVTLWSNRSVTCSRCGTVAQEATAQLADRAFRLHFSKHYGIYTG